jgi:putative salt-induced outer membrane protein YdiY
MRYPIINILVLVVFASVSIAPAVAQEDEKELGWFYSAELGYVLAAGNAESTSLNLGGSVRRAWERSGWLLEGTALRAETTTRTRSAVGTSQDDFTIQDQSASELTAENYFVGTRYDRMLSGNWYAFGSGSWLRNTFAGIDARYTVVGGVGNVWVDTEKQRFSTDYGLTYTDQTDVIENPALSNSYAGFMLGYDYWRQLTSTTDFSSQLFFNDSFSDTDNWRFNWLNSIQVSISQSLALKASLLLLYNNQPALEAISLENPPGTPTGETVLVELDELDTYFTLALVLTL